MKRFFECSFRMINSSYSVSLRFHWLDFLFSHGLKVSQFRILRTFFAFWPIWKNVVIRRNHLQFCLAKAYMYRAEVTFKPPTNLLIINDLSFHSHSFLEHQSRKVVCVFLFSLIFLFVTILQYSYPFCSESFQEKVLFPLIYWQIDPKMLFVVFTELFAVNTGVRLRVTQKFVKKLAYCQKDNYFYLVN